MTNIRIVLSTCSTREEAEATAVHLVESHLAACVNILPGAHSIYRWQDKIESADEILLLIKTDAAHMDRVRETIARFSSYELPEFLALAVEDCGPAYLAWLAAVLK